MANNKRPWSERWENLPATTRRNIVLGTIGGALFCILFLFVSADSKKPRRPVKEDLAKEIFTGADNKSMGLQGMAVSVKRIEEENAELRKKVENLVTLLEEEKKNAKPPEVVDENQIKASAVKEALDMFERRYGEKLKEPKPVPAPAPVVKPQPEVFDPSGSSADKSGEMDPRKVDWAPSTASAPQEGGKPAADKSKKVKMRVIGDDAKDQAATIQAEEKEKDQSIFLPAGSILSGTLITGMDAPTSESARKSPFPALLRIKKDALLPNRYRADVKECFIISSGYGDLSSERAYLRSETISCVRTDGGVIEAPIDMYAVGEDGKAGVRGILVSKQGALLSRSLLAGAMDSFSRIFSTVPVPTLSTSASDKTPFQTVLSKDSMQAAGVQGFGSAMERLADYFMDMAENIYPVIEVSAGRQIDFVMTKGTSLKLR